MHRQGTRIDESAHGARRCVEELRGLINCPELGKRSTRRTGGGDTRGCLRSWALRRSGGPGGHVSTSRAMAASARCSIARRNMRCLNASSWRRTRNLRLRMTTGGGRPNAANSGSWSQRHNVIAEILNSRQTMGSGTSSSGSSSPSPSSLSPLAATGLVRRARRFDDRRGSCGGQPRVRLHWFYRGLRGL